MKKFGDLIGDDTEIVCKQRLASALNAAEVVDLITHVDPDGRGIKVEQIGFRQADGSTIYLVLDTPDYLTILQPGNDMPEILEPVTHFSVEDSDYAP